MAVTQSSVLSGIIASMALYYRLCLFTCASEAVCFLSSALYVFSVWIPCMVSDLNRLNKHLLKRLKARMGLPVLL